MVHGSPRSYSKRPGSETPVSPSKRTAAPETPGTRGRPLPFASLPAAGSPSWEAGPSPSKLTCDARSGAAWAAGAVASQASKSASDPARRASTAACAAATACLSSLSRLSCSASGSSRDGEGWMSADE